MEDEQLSNGVWLDMLCRDIWHYPYENPSTHVAANRLSGQLFILFILHCTHVAVKNYIHTLEEDLHHDMWWVCF